MTLIGFGGSNWLPKSARWTNCNEHEVAGTHLCEVSMGKAGGVTCPCPPAKLTKQGHQLHGLEIAPHGPLGTRQPSRSHVCPAAHKRVLKPAWQLNCWL